MDVHRCTSDPFAGGVAALYDRLVTFARNCGGIEESELANTFTDAIYFTPTSPDGFIADETGNFDWAASDEFRALFESKAKRDLSLDLNPFAIDLRRRVYPLLDCIQRALNQQRRTGDYFQRLHRSILCDRCIQNHTSPHPG